MKLLQINTSVSSGSVGRIASEIGNMVIRQGHRSYIAYGRTGFTGNSKLFKVDSKKDLLFHLIKTRFFDLHGFGSKRATQRFIKQIEELNPEIIHLHNIHGYYIHIGVLFDYLKKAGKPVIWTLHDCWSFTGHCSYFDAVSCNKWKSECHHCPNIHGYPKSWLIDNSRRNYHQKRELFRGLDKMVLISPSEWLAGHLKNSFLRDYEIRVINNGFDLDKFRPMANEAVKARHNLNEKYILGVASTWDERKGLGDFIRIRKILDPEVEIVLVGLSSSQIKSLPNGIKAISRTESINELATLYSGAELFINPTYVDNFPSTNIEALACGTPVITYNTGGSPEAIDDKTGIVVKKGDVNCLAIAINTIIQNGKKAYSGECRLRAERLYDKNERYLEYLSLYHNIIDN